MGNSLARDRWTQTLGLALLISMIVNLYLIFMFAPTESSMGHIQRIFYFHVPSAKIQQSTYLLMHKAQALA